MTSVKPITPAQAREALETGIPDAIIKAVNQLLAKAGGKRVDISQDDVVSIAMAIDRNLTREEIHENNWLDFEPMFEAAGWKVQYDKPGFNENGEAFWTFQPKRSKRG